eukprot:SAG31_NODE_3133_length_4638_cov_6.219432_4_plen_63_part_00
MTEMTGWVQCDRCAKWRKFPATVPLVPDDAWVCSDNTWDEVRSYFFVFVPTIREIRDFYRER